MKAKLHFVVSLVLFLFLTVCPKGEAGALPTFNIAGIPDITYPNYSSEVQITLTKVDAANYLLNVVDRGNLTLNLSSSASYSLPKSAYHLSAKFNGNMEVINGSVAVVGKADSAQFGFTTAPQTSTIALANIATPFGADTFNPDPSKFAVGLKTNGFSGWSAPYQNSPASVYLYGFNVSAFMSVIKNNLGNIGFSQTYLGFAITSLPTVSVANTVNVFYDKAAFLKATGAKAATGNLPNLGATPPEGASVGTVTFTVAPGGDMLFIGTKALSGASATFKDWYKPMAGNDIALGHENLQLNFFRPVTAMGFLFAEPNITMPLWGGTPVDSTYTVTLYNGIIPIGSFDFNAPDDVVSFIGVQTDKPFTSAQIVDTTGNIDDEYFGSFFTVQLP